MLDRELKSALQRLATKEDIERFREDMTAGFDRVRRDIHALIDAIELMKYIDSQPR
jgi:hypothetical protein